MCSAITLDLHGKILAEASKPRRAGASRSRALRRRLKGHCSGQLGTERQIAKDVANRSDPTGGVRTVDWLFVPDPDGMLALLRVNNMRYPIWIP